MSNKLIKQILQELKLDRRRIEEENLNVVQLTRVKNRIAKNLASLRTLNKTYE